MNWTETEIKRFECLVAAVCVWMIMTGMWMIDIGASAQFISLSELKIEMQGIVSIGLEPRIVYHFGMIMQTVGMFVLVYMLFRSLIR